MPAAEICTLHISLIGSDPEIWRQLDIPTDITLDTLNEIVQAAMGWTGDHLWEFARGRDRFAPLADRDWVPANTIDAETTDLLSVLGPRSTTLRYLYDFGDCWEHRLRLTARRPPPPDIVFPRLVGGERNAPPEDCGGIDSFYDKLAALAEPDCDPELREWMDEYDPATMDAARIGNRLAAIAREMERARARRAAPPAPRRRSTKA